MPRMGSLGTQLGKTIAPSPVSLRVRVDSREVEDALRALRLHAPRMLEEILDKMSEELVQLAKQSAPVRTGQYQDSITGGVDRRGTRDSRQVVRAFLHASVPYAVYVEYQYHPQTGLWGCIVPVLEMFQRHMKSQLQERLFQRIEEFGVAKQ